MFMSNDGLNYLESGIAAVSLPAIGEQMWVFVLANAFQPRHLVLVLEKYKDVYRI